MARIEIKYDETTLPKDGQKVKYRNSSTLEWFEGVYNSEDQQFWTNPSTWEFAQDVDYWESFD
jgi:hypothetical protein